MSMQETIDQRLDALDRALLGLLPRSERLEFVTGIQARLESLPPECPAMAEVAAAASEPLIVASSASRRGRRSGMALTAGVLGIVAIVLLFVLPLTYLVICTLAEGIGEFISYALLSANVLVVALGGGAAVLLGIVALVRLSRQRGRLGHGWAITGLCTGPLPALAGGLGMIAFVFPMMAELADSGSTVPCTTDACYVPAPNDAPRVGAPAQVVSNSPNMLAHTQPWIPAALPPPAASGAYAEDPKYFPAPDPSTGSIPTTLPPSSETPSYSPPAQPADPAPAAPPAHPASPAALFPDKPPAAVR